MDIGPAAGSRKRRRTEPPEPARSKEAFMTLPLFQAAALIMGIWAAAPFCLAAENQPPAEGAALPVITLATPKDSAHQAYLGVAGKKQFTVADIPADVVIIQIFNMY
jgi:hypothetical protein